MPTMPTMCHAFHWTIGRGGRESLEVRDLFARQLLVEIGSHGCSPGPLQDLQQLHPSASSHV